MFSNRKLMATIALVGTIHAASADEASDAVQVLSKLWTATLDANEQLASDGKAYQNHMFVGNRYWFVGDVKTCKMRDVYHKKDGTVEDSTDVALFRFLEEYPTLTFRNIPPSSVVGVKCLFERRCVNRETLTHDPIYNPKDKPKKTEPRLMSYSFGVVSPADADSVRQALRTLIKLNAPPPFEPPDAPR
jgi:hypothetical protein